MNTKKRNFLIIWISNLLVSGTTTMIMPFLSLYIETMGNFTESYVQKWAGLIFGITFGTAFLMSPIWGRIADRFGYKPILLINGVGIASCILAMGFATSVEMLFFIRLFMGVVTGFIPTSLAFISSQTEGKDAGRTLGTLQTGSVAGTLFGPVVGGWLADTFGFTYTFFLTAGSITIATLLVLFFVHEVRRPASASAHHFHRKSVLFGLFHHRLMLNVMLVTALVQIGMFSVQPILSLYVTDLVQSAEQVAMLAGITFSATGLGNILFTRYWGKLGDQIGYEKVLSSLLLLCALFVVPQAFVQSLWQLIALRLLFGIAAGGLIPVTTAIVRREAPIDIQGEVMGYSTSSRFLGNIIGPMFGGLISGFIGMQSVFISTAILFVAAFVLLSWTRRRPEQDFEHVIEEEEEHFYAK